VPLVKDPEEINHRLSYILNLLQLVLVLTNN
jgi:hypothetical protein